MDEVEEGWSETAYKPPPRRAVRPGSVQNYVNFSPGDRVRLKTQTISMPKGTEGVVGPKPVGPRTWSVPKVIVEWDDKQFSTKWMSESALELIDPGPDQEEIRRLFHLPAVPDDERAKRAESAVVRVRALHSKSYDTEYDEVWETNAKCRECQQSWPCDTIKALEG